MRKKTNLVGRITRKQDLTTYIQSQSGKKFEEDAA